MNTPSLFRRFIRSVVNPNEQARVGRHAKRVVDAWRELLSQRGEVSGAALAREALAAYHTLSDTALGAFFDRLAQEFAPDESLLRDACLAWLDQPSPEHLVQLHRNAEPPRQELFRRLNQTPGGTAALVDVRKHVLAGLPEHPDWQAIDADLSHLFSSWFNRGFLTLQRIDWHTPAIILEKLIQYEAVHEISGWRDLRRRLEADRRCFAFFHPALPDEPLIFIEVALVKGMSDAIAPLLDIDAPVSDPQKADTAVFYSITNCQAGLRGVSFGNLLIKQVAQKLGSEFPRLRTFATLSPIPGFSRWLASVETDIASLPNASAAQVAIRMLAEPGWHDRTEVAMAMRDTLMPLCAHYLVHAVREGEPADSVARFHLGNGARLARPNWLADFSTRGLQRSAGMMVNYVYRLDEVEENHEIYIKEHRAAASRELNRLARMSVLAQPARKG